MDEKVCLVMIWTGEMLAKWEKCHEVQKKRKKRSFWRSTIFDHLPLEVLVMIANPLFYAPPPFVNPGSTTEKE